jgi:bacterioferritin-associated ferredoxin
MIRISIYYETDRSLWSEERKPMYVCLCKAVTDSQIERAVEQGAQDFATLQACLGVSTGCGRCRECAEGVMEQAVAKCACMPKVA